MDSFVLTVSLSFPLFLFPHSLFSQQETLPLEPFSKKLTILITLFFFILLCPKSTSTTLMSTAPVSPLSSQVVQESFSSILMSLGFHQESMPTALFQLILPNQRVVVGRMKKIDGKYDLGKGTSADRFHQVSMAAFLFHNQKRTTQASKGRRKSSADASIRRPRLLSDASCSIPQLLHEHMIPASAIQHCSSCSLCTREHLNPECIFAPTDSSTGFSESAQAKATIYADDRVSTRFTQNPSVFQQIWKFGSIVSDRLFFGTKLKTMNFGSTIISVANVVNNINFVGGAEITHSGCYITFSTFPIWRFCISNLERLSVGMIFHFAGGPASFRNGSISLNDNPVALDINSVVSFASVDASTLGINLKSVARLFTLQAFRSRSNSDFSRQWNSAMFSDLESCTSVFAQLVPGIYDSLKICVDLPRYSYLYPTLVSVPPAEKTGMSPMAKPKDSSRSSVLTNFSGLCDRIRKLADNCVGFQGFLRRLCNNGFSVLSLALINELVHLQNMAVFVVNEASIFASGPAYISSIVPDHLLMDVDQVQLPVECIVPPTVERDDDDHKWYRRSVQWFQIWRVLFDGGTLSPFQIWRAAPQLECA